MIRTIIIITTPFLLAEVNGESDYGYCWTCQPSLSQSIAIAFLCCMRGFIDSQINDFTPKPLTPIALTNCCSELLIIIQISVTH